MFRNFPTVAFSHHQLTRQNVVLQRIRTLSQQSGCLALITRPALKSCNMFGGRGGVAASVSTSLKNNYTGKNKTFNSEKQKIDSSATKCCKLEFRGGDAKDSNLQSM